MNPSGFYTIDDVGMRSAIADINELQKDLDAMKARAEGAEANFAEMRRQKDAIEAAHGRIYDASSRWRWITRSGTRRASTPSPPLPSPLMRAAIPTVSPILWTMER